MDLGHGALIWINIKTKLFRIKPVRIQYSLI